MRSYRVQIRYIFSKIDNSSFWDFESVQRQFKALITHTLCLLRMYNSRRPSNIHIFFKFHNIVTLNSDKKNSRKLLADDADIFLTTMMKNPLNLFEWKTLSYIFSRFVLLFWIFHAFISCIAIVVIFVVVYIHGKLFSKCRSHFEELFNVWGDCHGYIILHWKDDNEQHRQSYHKWKLNWTMETKFLCFFSPYRKRWVDVWTWKHIINDHPNWHIFNLNFDDF